MGKRRHKPNDPYNCLCDECVYAGKGAMKLDEIAERLLAHLKHFAASNALNEPNTAYWVPHVWVAGSRIGIRYVAYQCDHFLKKSYAEAYLQWLDAGNIGKHWKFESGKQVSREHS